MAFIDTTPASFSPKVNEADLQGRLGQLLATQNWTVAANVKKVVYDARWTKPSAVNVNTSVVRNTVAEHFIYKNAEGKMFGVAIAGTWEMTIGAMRAINKDPKVITAQEFADWATNEFRSYRAPHTLYMYMIEQTSGLVENNPDIVLMWEGSEADAQLRAALDIEVEKAEWKTDAQTTGVYTVTLAHLDRMQSPIMTAGLRTKLLDNYYSSGLSAPAQFTNWWYDSELSIKGHMTPTNLFLIIQADNVPAPEGNLVPSIPLYFGKIDPIEEGDEAYAMFVGSVPPGTSLSSIENYDFDNTTRLPSILPLLKSYPKYPANGLDSVMMSRSKLGSRYQAYYLSWNAPANAIPPERSKNGKDYPRAWNGAENPLYKYSFNPSRYSQKVHTSKVYLIHPEEGVRGSLKDTIALSALSFNANKLRVRKELCPNEYDVFRYFLVEGISPFTKKPGTQYRPAGIGLYVNTVDEEGIEITP
ncbi:hypothetical protein A7K91_08425 [Paenibacillus oryzae]|uniref:Uncharacterized protein n=1 Tax=Paenibacillus oryzae TaxID=1844972 RepID=A0A1A5YQS1_9BACL|nr:hypothetical protein [Paenibacillus oryzae]OBR67750.1 hypothetical protein A7K91_08425 [Paenibacillus oryzae]